MFPAENKNQNLALDMPFKRRNFSLGVFRDIKAMVGTAQVVSMWSPVIL